MRLLVAGLVALVAAGCGSSGTVTVAARCGHGSPPAGSLLILPTGGAAVSPVCRIAQSATDVVVPSNDARLARSLVAAAPGIRVWQERELQFGEPCAGCPTTPLPSAWIERHHPDWVLRDGDGDDIRGTLS